jgi:hypothetical protein
MSSTLFIELDIEIPSVLMHMESRSAPLDYRL